MDLKHFCLKIKSQLNTTFEMKAVKSNRDSRKGNYKLEPTK